MNKEKSLWIEIKIPNKNYENLFCEYFFVSHEASNIIYIQTPIGSVKNLKKAYKPFENYKYNIFAIDLSGIGKSEGNITKFNIQSLIEDIDACIDYIEKYFTGPIHLFASTGTGGILGQYYVSQTKRITSFAQYGVGIYKDVSFLKYNRYVVRIMYMILKMLAKITPNINIIMSLPKYNGYNKELDDSFYKMLIKENPRALQVNINVLVTLLEIFFDKDSALKNLPQCPTLVFETLHDRYFETDYFRNYFNKLSCKKKLVTINDVHNSYYFYPDKICQEVVLWFDSNEKS